MTQEVSEVKAADKVTPPAVLEKQLSTIFGRLYNLWTQNNKLWEKIAELEHSNVELRSLIKEAA